MRSNVNRAGTESCMRWKLERARDATFIELAIAHALFGMCIRICSRLSFLSCASSM